MLQGIVILCNDQFEIKDVFFNGFSNCKCEFRSQFSDLFDPEEMVKVDHFKDQLITNSVIFNIELTLECSNQFKPLKFSGSKYDQNFFIFGLETNNDVPFLYEELMRINNEQSNYIRDILKEQFMKEEAHDQSDVKTFEELTKLNNELANLQRELSKKNIELENLNNLKNRFLGMAAHDLRNPLGLMYSYAGLIEDKSDRLSSDQKEYLDIVKKMSMSMIQLVNELLDYSVIESGHINLSIEGYNVVELIANSVNLYQRFADKKSIQIDYVSSHPVLIAEIDKSKIEQVVSNLLTNAIKYSEKNTKVRVYISDKSDKIRFAVEDEGQGMTEKECLTLFRPFQKTSAVATGGESSTGLGLFISKRIIEAHQGHIWVNSEKGKGSIFYLEFPKQTLIS